MKRKTQQIMKSYCKKDYCKVDYFMASDGIGTMVDKIFIEGNFYETDGDFRLFESISENKLYETEKDFDPSIFTDMKPVDNDLVKIFGSKGEFLFFSLSKESDYPYYGDYFLDEIQVRKEKLNKL